MVTAIITTHNRIDVLPRAINSVLNQSYKDIELIVVSDGSTDGTDEYMKSYEQDNCVRYISYTPGHGGNYARNQGILNAKGEYLAFLDDDDEWLPEKIEKQVAVLNKNPEAGLVYAAVRSIYVNEGIDYCFFPKYEGDLSKRILIGNCIGTTSCVMVRRELVADELFDEELKAMQDHEMWIRLCQKTKVAYCNEVLLNYYNQTKTKQVTSNSDIYPLCKEYIHDKHKLLYNQLTDKEKTSLFVSEKLGYAQRCIRNGRKPEARKLIIESLKAKFSVTGVYMYISSFCKLSTIIRLRSMSSNIALHKLKNKQ